MRWDICIWTTICGSLGFEFLIFGRMKNTAVAPCILGRKGADCSEYKQTNLQDPSLGLNRARAGRLGRPARCLRLFLWSEP